MPSDLASIQIDNQLEFRLAILADVANPQAALEMDESRWSNPSSSLLAVSICRASCSQVLSAWRFSSGDKSAS
jgi:hypothetical protein